MPLAQAGKHASMPLLASMLWMAEHDSHGSFGCLVHSAPGLPVQPWLVCLPALSPACAACLSGLGLSRPCLAYPTCLCSNDLYSYGWLAYPTCLCSNGLYSYGCLAYPTCRSGLSSMPAPACSVCVSGLSGLGFLAGFRHACSVHGEQVVHGPAAGAT